MTLKRTRAQFKFSIFFSRQFFFIKYVFCLLKQIENLNWAFVLIGALIQLKINYAQHKKDTF